MHTVPRPAPSTRVTEVTRSRSLERFSALRRVDHEDTWCVRMDKRWPEHSAERCARVVLEEAAPAMREGLQRGWTTLGLKLDRRASAILGWTIRHESGGLVALALPSRIGMPAELIFRREGDDLLVATLLEYRNPLVPLIWRVVLPLHTRIVRALLTDACSRFADTRAHRDTVPVRPGVPDGESVS